MSNFIDEIAGKTGLPVNTLFGEYRFVVFGGKILYLEQHKGIYSIEDGEVIVMVKKGRFSVKGENLKILNLTENELVIEGVLTEVNFEKS